MGIPGSSPRTPLGVATLKLRATHRPQSTSVARSFSSAALATLIALSIAPAGVGAQASGTITGVVTTKAVALRPLRVTMDQRVCGNELPDESIVVGSAGHLANAVLTLVGVKGGAATPMGIMNEKCRFAPRVQIVRPNATITTSSKDPILHTTNAINESGKTLFNIAVPIPGIKINRQLASPGLVRLVCNTHPWMRGYVIVTDDRAAMTEADGKFTLPDVPPGTYQLRIWHETLKGEPQKVTVAAGRATTIDFELK
jgi:plastocyanin